MPLEHGTWYVVYAWWLSINAIAHERPDGGPQGGWYLGIVDGERTSVPQLHGAEKHADLAGAVAALLVFREDYGPAELGIYRQVIDGTVRPLERVR